jgi:hypothetical protein
VTRKLGKEPDPSDRVDTEALCFRTVGSRVVPYYKAKLDHGKTPIAFVTVGPTVDWSVAEESLGDMLHKAGYVREAIRESKISLR